MYSVSLRNEGTLSTMTHRIANADDRDQVIARYCTKIFAQIKCID